eukprot:XP_001704652.1 Hypothetical protein GL50803_102061 [Giardia lamblia ATCC 50803]
MLVWFFWGRIILYQSVVDLLGLTEKAPGVCISKFLRVPHKPNISEQCSVAIFGARCSKSVFQIVLHESSIRGD